QIDVQEVGFANGLADQVPVPHLLRHCPRVCHGLISHSEIESRSMGESVSGVGVLDKVITILGALEAGPLSLNELTEATWLPRATAHRLALALERHLLVDRDDGGRFMLGPGLVRLGRLASRSPRRTLVDAAAPVLIDLRDRTGESAQLYVRSGDTRV